MNDFRLDDADGLTEAGFRYMIAWLHHIKPGQAATKMDAVMCDLLGYEIENLRKLQNLYEPVKRPGENWWSCLIGPFRGDLPSGSDAPMRSAVERAFLELAGHEDDECSSGWGSAPSAAERAAMKGGANDEI